MYSQDLDEKYWENRYQQKETGWDIGKVSDPLKEYFDQITNKNQQILIPGCGRSYEAEYLHKTGFTSIFPSDIAESAKKDFFQRVANFPKGNWINENFFKIEQKFDLIIEQTFFCALDPKWREAYVKKMHELLKPQGKLIGLLFEEVPNQVGPPFGGNKIEYLTLFEPYFKILKMEKCYNSIEPRKGRELFFILEKK
jgi:SAM-dependent methyltransferase